MNRARQKGRGAGRRASVLVHAEEIKRSFLPFSRVCVGAAVLAATLPSGGGRFTEDPAGRSQASSWDGAPLFLLFFFSMQAETEVNIVRIIIRSPSAPLILFVYVFTKTDVMYVANTSHNPHAHVASHAASTARWPPGRNSVVLISHLFT